MAVHHAFLWDGDVIATETVFEDGRQREVDWFFEPDSFRPLARYENGQLAYIVNDHLGTPKELVAEDCTPLWAADHDTWGTVRRCKTWAALGHDLKPFTEDGTDWYEGEELVAQGNTLVRKEAAPDPLLVPIRFQGQWEDSEAGLFYNRFQYYEPLAAQYSSVDPMWLLEGMELHGYVSNAGSQIAPYGLKPCCYADNPQELCRAAKDKCGVDLNADQMREIAKTMGRIRARDVSQFIQDGTECLNDSSIEALPGIPSAPLQPGAYTEWTVRPWAGASQRGKLRIVKDTNTGRTNSTPNHYACLIEINPANF